MKIIRTCVSFQRQLCEHSSIWKPAAIIQYAVFVFDFTSIFTNWKNTCQKVDMDTTRKSQNHDALLTEKKCLMISFSFFFHNFQNNSFFNAAVYHTDYQHQLFKPLNKNINSKEKKATTTKIQQQYLRTNEKI